MTDREKVLIVVEGESDKKFIKDFIAYLKLRECRIDSAGGKDALRKHRVDIERYTKESHLTALIIFDANGDNNESRDYIKKILGDTFPDNNIFLFPDNRNPGELETLLKKIIHPNYAFVLDCYEAYKACLQNNGAHIPSGKKDLKWGVYAYCQAVAQTNPDETKYQNRDHWDLDNPYLEPLKKFLTDHIPPAS